MITGTIKVINATQQITEKFKKRSFVITTEEKYPQTVELETLQEDVTILDGLKVGDRVEVSYNIRGREWIKKDGSTGYFNSLQAWRIDIQVAPEQTTEASDIEDLPF